MRKLFFTFVFALMISTIGIAQDRVQGTVTIAVNELNSQSFDNLQNKRTIDAGVRVNLLPIESKWVFGPAFSYQRQYGVQVIAPNAEYPMGVERDVDYYYGGAELARKIGKFRLGGGFYLGTTKLHEDMDYKLVRKYRGFADVKLTEYIGLRLFQAELQASGSFNFNNLISPNRSTNYGTGLFITF